MTEIEVVAGILISKDLIYIAQRKKGEKQGEKWEFPGGKVNSGEKHEEALKREIREEFKIEIKVLKKFCEVIHRYEIEKIKLIAFLAEPLSEITELKAHQDAKWVVPEELTQFDFSPADIPITQKLVKFWEKRQKKSPFAGA